MIKFGTSGFRGIIGDNWTKQNIQKIGAAFRKVAEAQTTKTTQTTNQAAGQTADKNNAASKTSAIESSTIPSESIQCTIGFDNRFMGREAAQWFCEAACSDKVRATFMNDPVPSPYIAYKATAMNFGIIITASHNPYEYNGIKIFLNGGKEADDDFCASITQEIENLKHIEITPFKKLAEIGIVNFSNDTNDYINKIVSLLDTKTIKASAPKVLFNPMYGSSTDIVRKLLQKLNIEYSAINDTADPYFGGSLPAPYPHNLSKMASTVVKEKYDLGIALDGDGDRVAVIDSNGKIFDCNYLCAVCMYYMARIKNQNGGAVKNFLTSNLIVKICQHYGLKVHETPIGFKFIGAIWESTDALIGAESGGMGFRQVSLSKDGIATAAFIIDIAASLKSSISSIVNEIANLVSFPSAFLEFAYPFTAQDRESVLSNLASPNKPKFSQNIIRVDAYFDGFKIVFPNDYWCAARLSGNENVLRLYAEMANESECSKIIETMEKFYNLTERQK